MAHYVGPKCRLCRREGKKLFLKGARCYTPKCPIDRRGAVPPGQHGQKHRRRPSDYSFQLREKQKAKRIYGVLERQFRCYFKKAALSRHNSGEILLQILERRLDNVLFRLGLTPSRSVARQLINHGHALVNNRKISTSSYQVSVNDIVTLSPKILKTDLVKTALAEKTYRPPAWLSRQAAVGKVVKLPKRDDIDFDIDESLIINFYSR